MGWTVYNSDGQILQSAGVSDNAITTAKILDDAVTVAKLANSINTDIDANTAKTGITSGQASAITANTAKVTNATHSGEVTGATALTIAADAVTTVKILDANVTNAKVATGIDAVKLADGSVTNAELQYINSLSSNAQTQLAAKHGSITSSARLNANLIGANGNVSNTEYGYLSGVTSDIQTQLAAGGGSITREGSSTAEVTSTSTDDADINTVSGLSIGVLEPFESISCLRRTGQSGRTRVGYKVNSIDTHSPGSWQHADVSATLNALRWIRVAPRVTNYFRCGLAFAIPDGGNHIHGTGFDNAGRAAEFPNATITSVTILVASNTSNITQGGDELHVYSMSVS